MKKIVLGVVLILLFSGCIGFFDKAEKTTSVEFTDDKVITELTYEGSLTEKGNAVEDCKKELLELFPSAEASAQANINDLNEEKRLLALEKLSFLKELKESFSCEFTKQGENSVMKIRFENSLDTIKKLSVLMPGQGIEINDLNNELTEIKISKLNEYFASEIIKENFLVKPKGEIIEVKPERFSIKNGFVSFFNTGKDANIQITVEKEKQPEFPFLLVAASFILLIAVAVIIVAWKNRAPEEIFPHSEAELKERMRKELINGLATTDISILKFEKNINGYEGIAQIKTRKYHVAFNKKMELKGYVKLSEENEKPE